ncbi:MAG: decaprenyl-phosphate phosphoribosyltransferase [Anaerolineae bacterium]|nr:decaprenyl-phosphate phosphoribosyltransferase [Thermoflexales bacterium]MDW8396059.1 decaprenyl-phosphate phosphoribosyltransferase [Anaerolineae bacterium]
MHSDKAAYVSTAPAWTVAKGLWVSLRPKQWIKNLFVFAPLVFDSKLFQPQPLVNTLVGFAALCAISSSVYLLNDCADRRADQQHPKKRNRPIARGDVPVGVAIGAAIVLALTALGVGFVVHVAFGLILAGYLAVTSAYTFKLKHVVLLDVFVLASGFVLRVAAGIPLVEAERFSPWLYTCAGLLALLIGFGKRRAELVDLKGSSATRAILAEYSLPLLDQIIAIITGALIVSYTFYTFSAPQLPPNHTMMLSVPLVAYALFRYLYLMHVKGMAGAPDELVLRDRPLQAAFLAWAGVVILVIYVLA